MLRRDLSQTPNRLRDSWREATIRKQPMSSHVPERENFDIKKKDEMGGPGQTLVGVSISHGRRFGTMPSWCQPCHVSACVSAGRLGRDPIQVGTRIVSMAKFGGTGWGLKESLVTHAKQLNWRCCMGLAGWGE